MRAFHATLSLWVVAPCEWCQSVHHIRNPTASSALQLEEAAKMEAKRQSVAENVAAMARAAEAAAARRLAATEAAAQTRAAATPAAEPSGRDNADELATAAVAAEEENEAGVAEGAEGDYCSQTCHDGLHTMIVCVCTDP